MRFTLRSGFASTADPLSSPRVDLLRARCGLRMLLRAEQVAHLHNDHHEVFAVEPEEIAKALGLQRHVHHELEDYVFLLHVS